MPRCRLGQIHRHVIARRFPFGAAIADLQMRAVLRVTVVAAAARLPTPLSPQPLPLAFRSIQLAAQANDLAICVIQGRNKPRIV